MGKSIPGEDETMKKVMTTLGTLGVIVASVPAAASPATGADGQQKAAPRFEAAIGVHGWPKLADIRATQGEFDEAGFSLAGAAHWPLSSFGNGKLLIGADIGAFTNDSNIPLLQDTLISRGAYVIPSVKWRAAERFSFDLGIGLYLVDIAEVDSEYFFTETEVWEQGTAGGYVGATWDMLSAGGSPTRGFFISAKVHFFELGPVRDEDETLPVRFGRDAGDLSGPLYQLQLGYRW